MSASRSNARTESKANDEAVRAVVPLAQSERSTEPDSVGVWRPDYVDIESSDTPAPLNLVVRGARLTDLFGLGKISTVQLNQPDIGLDGYSAMRSELRSALPIARSKPFLYVATVESRLVGMVQFQPTSPDRRWHAIAIGTATGVYHSGPVEDGLLRHAITAAGLRGVKRLFARLPSGSELVESFGRIGFAPYATETIFVADVPQGRAKSVPVRRQETSDTWAIHQLHNSTVPKQVQYAEAITSHRWDLRGRDELAGGGNRLGWLVDDNAGLAAYGRVLLGPRANSIELLYSPDRTETIGGLLDRILTDLRSESKQKRVYCTLRGYQVEAAKELEMRGFEPILEQDLLVKYTTATARAPQFEPLPLHSELIERLPKRVPSFLSQTPKDEKAG